MNPNRPTRPQYYPNNEAMFSNEDLIEMISQMPPNAQTTFQNYVLSQQNFGFNSYTQQNAPQFPPQLNTSPQFRPENYVQRNPVNVGSTESVPEIIPESPPSVTQAKGQQPAGPSQKPRRAHKKKPEGEPRAKITRMPWNDHELMCLARAWVEIATDPNAANYQRGMVFWARIREAFFSAMGVGEDNRTPDMIRGKWTDLNRACLLFNGIYNRKNNMSVPSGESLGTWAYDAADKEYKALKGFPFQHKAVWEYLHTHQKWLQQPSLEIRTTRPSKRSKTDSSSNPESQSSDAHTLNLNDEAEDDEPVFVEPERPSGRRSGKGKKVSSSSTPDNENALSQIAAQISRLGDEAQKRREFKEKKYNDYIKMKDWEQLRQSTAGMTDEEKAIN